MSGFSSSFMPTTNLGSWDYYIFSDNNGLWRSLNGLAAWFSGSGGMLQNAAWLGALLVLAIGIFGAAIKKPSMSSSSIGVWFFFMSSLGMTGQANIYNIYTNQVTVVQNVPAKYLPQWILHSKVQPVAICRLANLDLLGLWMFCFRCVHRKCHLQLLH